MKYVIYIVQSLMLLMLTPLFMGIIKNFKATIRGYKACPVLQPYYNISKLFGKEGCCQKAAPS